MSTAPNARKRRVLVIYKKSTWERYRRAGDQEHIDRLLANGDPAIAQLIEAHDEHQSTLDEARAAFKRLGVSAVFRYRWQGGDVDDCDLLVTLGGDGTLLWASHFVGPKTPVVAINSAPRASVGYFCAGDKHALEATLGRALSGELPRAELTRMQVEVDGQIVSSRVLNDILFCHVCPAVTSRYVIAKGDVEEEQRSSGIWVGPPAGSTAAIRSAGGMVLPLLSEELQFVVREPYHGDGLSYRLEKGRVAATEELVIRSRMREARIYIDGAHRNREVDFGAVIRLRRSPEPLVLLGLRKNDAMRQ